MGYKAKVRALESYNEYLKKRAEALHATVKAIVMEKGETDEKTWKLRIPMLDAEETNKLYTLTAEPKEDYLLLTVEQRGDKAE